MNIRTIFSAAALTFVVACGTLTAQTYSLGYDQTRYDTVGDDVEVTLLLREDISGGGTARLDAANDTDDLFSFSLSVDYSSFVGASGSTFESLEFAPGFVQSSDTTFTTISDSGSVVSFESSVGLSDGLAGRAVSASQYEIELATLVFNAGSIGSETTLLSGISRGLTGGNPPLFFEDGGSPTIDDFGTAQIFVNAVPEPGSATVIAMLAGVALLKRRRS